MTAKAGGEVRLDEVDHAVAAIAAGGAVVVVDDEGRENEGDLIFAAARATPELVAFMVRWTSGYICAALPGEAAERLDLPPMTTRNQDVRGTAYRVTVDHAEAGTGISAGSRALTLRRLADPAARAAEFTRPGHVVPLAARAGGVLVREGHTEAAVDLCRAAGLEPTGALCEIVSEEDPAGMARGPELRRFADRHGLPMISIEQLIDWRRHHDRLVERVVETRLPTDHGEFRAVGFRDLITGVEHMALVMGEPDDGDGDVLVRVHSECLTGDVFGSRRCDCGQQLGNSLRMVQREGRGIILYLRGQEGRGIGLVEKLRAYRLQDAGLDTVDANLELRHPADAREFDTGAQILRLLGVRSVRLLTNNPAKLAGLSGHGFTITGRAAVPVTANRDNVGYLRTKRDRMGHDLPAVARWDEERERAAARGKDGGNRG